MTQIYHRSRTGVRSVLREKLTVAQVVKKFHALHTIIDRH
jgi:hypothetical protein